jgi:large subunit ribosomal protein L23
MRLDNQISRNDFRTTLELIKHPVLTDKSRKLVNQKKYTFVIAKKVNKYIIKKLINYLFEVDIHKITTLNIAKKKSGRSKGYKPSYKKVVITLKYGSRLDSFPTESFT